MRLLALPRNTKNDPSIFFYEVCPYCKETFFYKTKGMLVSVFDREYFKIDFDNHKNECMFAVQIGFEK